MKKAIRYMSILANITMASGFTHAADYAAGGAAASSSNGTSTAVGDEASAGNIAHPISFDYASSFGYRAATWADNGTAIGANSQVSFSSTNSVALGQGSIADAANTVSVGSSGSERRITNVDEGTGSTDAVNYGQLSTTNANVATNATNISNNATAIAALQGGGSNLSSELGKLEDRVHDTGSMNAALSALVPNSRAAGDTQVSVGMGNYRDSTAVAAGMFHYVNNNVLLNAGVSTSFNSSDTVARAGITIGW